MTRHILLLFPLLLVVSCASSRREALAGLEPSVLQFCEQLKWFNGELSRNYVPPALRAAYVDQLDAASRKISVASIEVIRITPDAKAKKAVVRMRVEWTSKDEDILRNTLVESSWENIQGNWYHTGAKVVDGPPVPLLFGK